MLTPRPTRRLDWPQALRSNLGARLERWSRVHAAGMLAALAVGTFVGSSVPLVLFAAISFGALVTSNRREWTPSAVFGWANSVTALRLLLLLTIACASAPTLGWRGCVAASAALLLDGIDGWLARRLGTSSAFGAHFDMEVDAVFVVIVTHALWQRGFGVWILTAGWLRYAYVLFNAWVGGQPTPRFAFARIAFAALGIGLCAAFVLPAIPARLAASIATLMVGASFARSFYFSWATRSARRRRS